MSHNKGEKLVWSRGFLGGGGSEEISRGSLTLG